MSWDNHIDCVNLLQKTSFVLPRKAKEERYDSCTRTIIENGNIIYNNSTITKLDKLQRRCSVICLNWYKLIDTVKLCRELEWDTLEHRQI